MINKEVVADTVRMALMESLSPKDPYKELVNEAREAFRGMDEIILENATMNPQIVKNMDKTKTMFLEKGDHRIMVISNNRQHEALDLASDERKQFNTRGELITYIRDMKEDGFRVIKNKSAIARFLTKSVRKIASYIRKYGLITLVGVGIAAAVIYFVGPMAVPFLGNLALKLGVGDMIGGGESVEVVGDGWVTPMEPTVNPDLVGAADAIGDMTNQLSAADVQSTLTDIDNKINGLSTAIPALVDQGEYELAAQYGREMEALEAQKTGFEGVAQQLQAAERTAQVDAAAAAAATAEANRVAKETYMQLLRDPNTPKDMIPVYADAVKKLSQ